MKPVSLICAAAILLICCSGCAKQNMDPAEPSVTQSNSTVTDTTPESIEPTTAESTETEPTTSEIIVTVSTASEPIATVSTSSEPIVTVSTASEPSVSATTETNETEAAPEESGEEAIDKDYIYQDEDDFFYVVNKTYLLPEDYEIQTEIVQGEREMEKTAAKYMREMIAAAKEDGINLKVLSAYRSVKYQKRLFERNVKSRMEEDGMTYNEAYYDTAKNIAPPGGSEHNAGLAADIVTENDWDTYTAFEDTDEFAWLIAHAPEYGYILRYPKGKKDITGYVYEPWHYRYVGVKYARDVMDSGLCLEEYFEKYVWVDGVEPSFPFES